MGYLAGETMTAARTNRLQTKTDGAIGSSTVAPSQTNADVPSATVTMVTETAAQYKVSCVWDVSASGSGGITTGRLAIDGVNQSPLATFQPVAANHRATVAQNYEGVLGAAGSHTFKLVATTGNTSTVQGVNCSIIVEITEVA